MLKKQVHSQCILLMFLVAISAFAACKPKFSPRPRGYLRIDLPEKEYKQYISKCSYRFEYPVYGEIVQFADSLNEPCWMNIDFPAFRSRIHLTYKSIDNNLMSLTEDIRTLAYKHIIKADDIIEMPVSFREKNVYGIIYDIKGNTASSFNFYLTDSTDNFFSGALYFNVLPNKDSLAPVITFFKTDIEHLIETFEWE